MNQPTKLGLVLAGGGAKGAYHVGVLRYLAELEFQPHIISGTSIGALNGAVIASHANLADAVHKLDAIWTELGDVKVISPNPDIALQLASYFVQTSLPTFGKWFKFALNTTGLLSRNFSFFDPEPLEKILRETINPTAIRQGTELWATVFPAIRLPYLDYDLLLAGVDLIRAKTGTKAEWLRVQDCDNDETLLSLLLASAAIPLCFPHREINGKTYVDGALQDNIPLGALAKQGCTHAIVIHLDGGSAWNRVDFPGITIIEVRPQSSLNSFNTALLGDAQAMLNFSTDQIAKLKIQGYQDAQRCLQPLLETAQALNRLPQSSQALQEMTNTLDQHRLL